MTIYRRALPLALLLGLAPLPALAQPPTATAAPKAPGKGEQQALEWFLMLDADGDGRISRDEARLAFRIKPSLLQLFNDTDTNGDGYLTQDEIRAAAGRRRAERQRRKEAEAAAASGPRAPAQQEGTR